VTSSLRFVALGGIGEIGLNLYLYELDGRWLMVDCGIAFADDRHPGADIILPDIAFIEERKERLDGIILTHAHEDHLGAVPYLWERLGCPIYCTTFPAAVLRRKLAEHYVKNPAAIHQVKNGERFTVGPFGCRLIHMTHSIPEASALAIDSPWGVVMHTGDWKLDPAPMLGEPSDIALLEEIGAEGVLALVADSTNVLSPGTSGSEAEVRDSLRDLIAAQPHAVALTTFASNVARLETAMLAAAEAGREIVVVGRSMHRMIEAAKECGYLKGIPPLRDERDAAGLPRHRTLYLVTGSQGEPRAAMQRIATGNHQRIRLEAGDTAIFSSKIIPGNERTLYSLHNHLVELGVEVITEEDHFVHVSGHPCRDEMEQMYRWMKPKIAIPVHGEARHLYAHARFAKSLGVEQALVVRNGDLVRLGPPPAKVESEVHTGRRVLETDELLDSGDELYRSRRRLASHGTVVVGLVLDPYGSVLAAPQLTAIGAIDLSSFGNLEKAAADLVAEAVEDLQDEDVLDDERVAQAVRGAVRQALSLPRHKRPIVEVQVTRLSPSSLASLEDEAGEARVGAA